MYLNFTKCYEILVEKQMKTSYLSIFGLKSPSI